MGDLQKERTIISGKLSQWICGQHSIKFSTKLKLHQAIVATSLPDEYETWLLNGRKLFSQPAWASL